MTNNMAKTQIQVSVETRENLKKIGTKGQSYDSLVTELIQLKEKYKDWLTFATCGGPPTPLSVSQALNAIDLHVIIIMYEENKVTVAQSLDTQSNCFVFQLDQIGFDANG